MAFQPVQFLESLGDPPVSDSQKITNDALVKTLSKGKLKSLAQHFELPIRSGALKPELYSAVVGALWDDELVTDDLLKSVGIETESVEVINARAAIEKVRLEAEAREADKVRDAEAKANEARLAAEACEADKARDAEKARLAAEVLEADKARDAEAKARSRD